MAIVILVGKQAKKWATQQLRDLEIKEERRRLGALVSRAEHVSESLMCSAIKLYSIGLKSTVDIERIFRNMADETNQEQTQVARLEAAFGTIDTATNSIAETVVTVKADYDALVLAVKNNPDSSASLMTLAQRAEESGATLTATAEALKGIGKLPVDGGPVDPPVETPQP